MRTWLRIVLAVSLTLNLVVIGLVLGAVLNHDRDFRKETALSDIGIGPFIAALPQESRRELGAELVGRAGSLRQNREMLKQQFESLLGSLRADPYDPEGLRAVTKAQEDKLRERQDIGRELLYGLIDGMTVAERQAYADRLEEGFRRGPRMWRGDQRRDGDDGRPRGEGGGGPPR